ncbi:hypothetical protein E2562_029991 [Oryza meyeriana var. granulata]|uniref:Uncharacterized protein n=1 Tax=Oryza meyeriana var. granulata TaxID=110450 RepID=A0A6G1ER48_9ORYZ|nr:hypothetical protein E2562_029991 [Oryza meyeriana var. granulata]
MQKDAYLGNDLARVARIDWSKAVFDSICDTAFLLYIDDLHLPQDNGVDPMHTPQIQLYTKDMVEQISQLNRTGRKESLSNSANLL